MIFVECTVINLKTRQVAGKYHKQFDMPDDFSKWYKLAKESGDTFINLMKFNPLENPLLKQVNDVKLLSVSKEYAT